MCYVSNVDKHIPLSLIVDKRLYLESFVDTFTFHFNPPIRLTNTNTLLNVSQLKTGIFNVTHKITRTITLPNANIMIEFLDEIGKCADIMIINPLNDLNITMGHGGNLIGNSIINTNTYAVFRIRITRKDIPMYTVYRLS
jgi:hypothetical protein